MSVPSTQPVPPTEPAPPTEPGPTDQSGDCPKCLSLRTFEAAMEWEETLQAKTELKRLEKQLEDLYIERYKLDDQSMSLLAKENAATDPDVKAGLRAQRQAIDRQIFTDIDPKIDPLLQEIHKVRLKANRSFPVPEDWHCMCK